MDPRDPETMAGIRENSWWINENYDTHSITSITRLIGVFFKEFYTDM